MLAGKGTMGQHEEPVNPGATDTGYASEELRETVARAHPLGRWGEPNDAARLIAWLVGLITLNFDFAGPETVPWDQPTTVDFSNVPGGG